MVWALIVAVSVPVVSLALVGLWLLWNLLRGNGGWK
jgi:hypothetical protein